MIRTRLLITSALMPFVLGLSGCMHVPVSTVYKLATFDVVDSDPGVIRAAVRYPQALAVQPGGVVLTITTSGREGGKGKGIETFVLEHATERTELDAIARYRRDGMMVATYRLSGVDTVRARHLLAQHKEAVARGERPGSKGIGVAATACHVAGLPSGAILTSTFLKLDGAGYMPVIEDLDLRSQLSAEDLAAHVRPCVPSQ
ncbi:MAG: hypothetical protein ABL901_04555 [Hyphomicrobiaceae bacterium]